MAQAVEHWFRSYHGAPTDKKWISIARRAGPGVTPGMVASLWWALLDHASQATPRGSVASFDVESIADFFGYDETQCNAVKQAFCYKHLIDAADMLTTWSEHQPKRHDDSTERVRKFREHNKLQKEPGNGNAVKRSVTLGNARGEERREEKKETTETTTTDGAVAPRRGRKAKDETALPDDFAANTTDLRVATEEQVDPARSLMKMRDWAAANGMRSKDWHARYRNWIREDGERQRAKAGGRNHEPGPVNGAGNRLPRAAPTAQSVPLGDLLAEVRHG
jgi:hypothetical protein